MRSLRVSNVTNRFRVAFKKARELANHRSTRGVWIVCSVAGGIGLSGLMAIAFRHHGTESPSPWIIAAEHAASALVVASFMGLTYEFYLHSVRSKLDEQRVTQAISQVSSVLPQTVFDLLAGIAAQSSQVPTLYRRTRDSMREVVFLQDYEVLRQLLEFAAARGEEERVLERWFKEGSDYRLRFLGSDMVGLFKRKRFAERLRAEGERMLGRWNLLSTREKEWTLNYIWAASRCEVPMYASLEKLLLTTPHHDIQEWILFVPQQMPHPLLLPMMSRYMKDERHQRDAARLQLVLEAFAHLPIGKRSFRKYSTIFYATGLSRQYSDVRDRRAGVDRRQEPRHTADRRSAEVTFQHEIARYDDLWPT
jgi:hypothetical protein